MEQLKFSVQDICRIYRVPSYMVNDSEKATTWGTGLEQMNLGFLTYTLRPYLTRFEQSWNLNLLTEDERKAGLYCEFNLDALLRADSAGRAAYYSTAVQNGLMTRNEVRRKENAPASTEPNADALTVQVNLVPLGKLGEEPPPPKPAPGGPPK
jgi:HK97 family phage portal protein